MKHAFACLGFEIASVACGAPFELSGILTGPDGPRVALVDVADKTPSPWLAVGQSFRDQTIVAVDEQARVATVMSGTTRVDLRLKAESIGVADTKAGSVDASKEPKAAPSGLFAGPTDALRPGDTLAKVARDSGIPLARLLELNPGVNPARLQVGQVLRLRAEP